MPTPGPAHARPDARRRCPVTRHRASAGPFPSRSAARQTNSASASTASATARLPRPRHDCLGQQGRRGPLGVRSAYPPRPLSAAACLAPARGKYVRAACFGERVRACFLRARWGWANRPRTPRCPGDAINRPGCLDTSSTPHCGRTHRHPPHRQGTTPNLTHQGRSGQHSPSIRRPHPPQRCTPCPLGGGEGGDGTQSANRLPSPLSPQVRGCGDGGDGGDGRFPPLPLSLHFFLDPEVRKMPTLPSPPSPPSPPALTSTNSGDGRRTATLICPPQPDTPGKAHPLHPQREPALDEHPCPELLQTRPTPPACPLPPPRRARSAATPSSREPFHRMAQPLPMNGTDNGVGNCKQWIVT